MIRRTATALAACLVLGGCGYIADRPPDRSPVDEAPRVVTDAAEAEGISDARIPTLRQDGFNRRAATITVRVRNLSCSGVGSGSGFALDRHTLVTNRHVVAGAERVEVETADGRSLSVSTTSVGVLGDVAFVRVKDRLPAVADTGGSAAEGADIAAVGYPLGGPFTVSRGVVVDRVDGAVFTIPGDVVRVTARVVPGNSGGPLLDARGRVAGVVFAIETATGLGLAIPMDTVDQLLERGGLADVPGCGVD